MIWRNVYRRPAWPRRMLLRNLNDLHGNVEFQLGGTRGPIQSRFPAINGWINDEGLVITAEVPGVEPGDIDISIEDETLTLSGARNESELPAGTRFIRRERGRGRFTRTVELPFRVDMDAVKAHFHNGALKIELPRLPEEKPKKIEINVSQNGQ